MWHSRVHLNAVEALLHVPFVMRLLDFFNGPCSTGPVSELTSIDSDLLPVRLRRSHSAHTPTALSAH